MTKRRRIPTSALKLGIFASVALAVFALVATLVGNITFVPSNTYYGLFTNAAGVVSGNSVRISGVEVGSIRSVSLAPGADGTRVARVEFTVDKSVPLFASAHLQLRYENIVGQRYLEIQESANGGSIMRAGGTFPATHTSPALNLTALFNGFQPLFHALNPADLNRFSFELVQALQGESGSLAALTQDTAQLTNAIADKDAVIGRVVANLGQVLDTVGSRDQQLSALINQFRNLMTGLAENRDAVAGSLPALADLLDASTGYVQRIRPPLKGDVAALNTLVTKLDKSRSHLASILQTLPNMLRVMVRTGSYGSWFNFYNCGLEVRIHLAHGTINLGGVGASANERDTVCGGGIQ